MYKSIGLKIAAIVVFASFFSCKSSKEFGNRSLRKPTVASEYVYHKAKKKTNTEKKVTPKVIENHRVSNNARVSVSQIQIVEEAEKYMGIKYQYNGKSPNRGFDCSGLVSWVYAKSGNNLAGSSDTQSKKGKRVSMSELMPGDLMFFGEKGKVSHVSIVKSVEENNIFVIHATSSRGVVVDEVKNSSYWRPKYLFSNRVLDSNDLATN